MLQIGYFSASNGPQDASPVHNILVKSRHANRRDSITGLLVAGSGHYLQVIEGPRSAVEALYGRIQEDARHFAVASFSRRRISERSFGSWSMAFRRQTASSEPNSFSYVLGALTRDIPDEGLKQQIRYFVGAMMHQGARSE